MFAQPPPPPLIKSPGEWGSCVAAKGQLYITLLKVITEILNWNHSAASVCQKPLQRCLARSGASLPPRPPEKWSLCVSYHKRRARESPTWNRAIQLQRRWVKTHSRGFRVRKYKCVAHFKGGNSKLSQDNKWPCFQNSINNVCFVFTALFLSFAALDTARNQLIPAML